MACVLLSAPWPCLSAAPLPLPPTPCCPARRVPPAWAALVARLPWRPAMRGCGSKIVRSRPAKDRPLRGSVPLREQPGRRSTAVPCSVPAPSGWGRPLGAAGLGTPSRHTLSDYAPAAVRPCGSLAACASPLPGSWSAGRGALLLLVVTLLPALVLCSLLVVLACACDVLVAHIADPFRIFGL